MCIAAQLGARINSLPHADVSAALFSESAGRLVVEVAASDVEAVSAIIGPAHVLGTVTAQPVFTIDGVFEVDLGELTTAFAGKSW
jgi:phosphoribosylformylglycinamidine synthase subunit PurL